MATHARSAPGKPKKEREPWVLDAAFQAREMMPLVVFVILYAVLLFGVLFIPLGSAISTEPDMGVRIILQEHMNEIHLRLWPLLAVAGLMAAYFAFYRSVNIIRPVYRLHYVLRDVAAGEHQPFRARPREEFRFFEDDVAQLNQKMKLLSTRNRDILLNVNAHVKKLGDRLESGEVIPRADLEEVVAAIRAQLEKGAELTPAGRP